ncbi:ornithine carbamoyltransferase [Buchnera aphidicola]|uniref:ornithine carbamoyltransferase n=1 Tax=Buchnera aphidicola TaxID=9 RepID=UPI003464995C
MNTLYKKNFLKISDFNKQEILNIIILSKKLKQQRKENTEIKYLKNKKFALIFEKESTRTRCSFEIAALEQGAYTSYLSPGSIHLGYKESILDTLHFLEKIYDGIVYRGNNHNNLKKISKNSSIPIWNGLTEKHHPTQILADLLTIIEYSKKSLFEIKLVYIGDASNNIANSLLEMAILFSLQICFIAPKEFWPKNNKIQKYEKKYNTKNTCTENIAEGIKYADFIYTDVWISLGEPKKNHNKKITLLKKYQINQKLLALTNNSDVKVLHCLPALHDNQTNMGKEISQKYNLKNGIEITDIVFQKNKKIIFEQSENKMHTIKALMIYTLNKKVLY